MENAKTETASGQHAHIEGQFAILLELQDFDRKTHEWDTQRLAKLKAVEEAGARIKQVQEQLAGLKKAGEAKVKSRAALEMDAKARQETVKKYNGQLLELKSNEAYSAMNSEIKKAQEEISVLEDKILVLMEAEEADRRKMASETAGLNQQIKEAEAVRVRLSAEAQELQDQASAAMPQREKMLGGLWKELADIYVRMVKAMKGSPVAKVLEGNCDACRMKIPPHTINEIRKAKAVNYCPHCGRILIYPKA